MIQSRFVYSMYSRAALIILMILLSACSTTVTQTAVPKTGAPVTGEPATVPTQETAREPSQVPVQGANVIVVEDQQAGPDVSVLVKSVTVDQPAWLVVGIDVDGNPGPGIDFAYAKVEAGTTENVTIALRRPPPFPMQREDGSWLLWVELYSVQGNEDETSPMLNSKPILNADGKMVAASFSFTLAPPP